MHLPTPSPVPITILPSNKRLHLRPSQHFYCLLSISFPLFPPSHFFKLLTLPCPCPWINHSRPPIETTKPVMLFLSAVRIMNFNITISAASINVSYYLGCLATIIVSVKETLRAVSFATYISTRYTVNGWCRWYDALYSAILCSAVLCCLSAYITMEVMLAAGFEKVQRETLSLLDNVSTTILTSTV